VLLLLFVDNPCATIHEYNWEIKYETTAPFSSLVSTHSEELSSEKKLLFDSKQLISEFLNPTITNRCGIWNIYKVTTCLYVVLALYKLTFIMLLLVVVFIMLMRIYHS
jgi:hypothetical protein